jgi:hypothetical protein
MDYLAQAGDSSAMGNIDTEGGLGLDQKTLVGLVEVVETQLSNRIVREVSAAETAETVETVDESKLSTCQSLTDDSGENAPRPSTSSPTEDNVQERAKFIFHPAGVSDKLEAIKAVLALRGLSLPKSLEAIDSFRLLRTKIV